jgi:glucosamine--fructose-6-phosphate aminotransferase (isomerizing)
MTLGTDSRMFSEAAQAPNVVRGQLENNAVSVRRIGALLREMSPRAVVTCARGSSDHAATFAKYLIESNTKLLTTSAAPSMSSLYDAQPDLRGVVFLVISQSGKSPDLLASAENAKRNGACVIALCNSLRHSRIWPIIRSRSAQGRKPASRQRSLISPRSAPSFTWSHAGRRIKH